MLIFTIPLGLRRHPLEGFLKNKVFDLAPRYWQTPGLEFNTSGPMAQPGERLMPWLLSPLHKPSKCSISLLSD